MKPPYTKFLIDESEEDMSDVKPELKSLTNELTFIKHMIEATYNSFVIIGLAKEVNEKIINNTKQTIN